MKLAATIVAALSITVVALPMAIRHLVSGGVGALLAIKGDRVISVQEGARYRW